MNSDFVSGIEFAFWMTSMRNTVNCRERIQTLLGKKQFDELVSKNRDSKEPSYSWNIISLALKGMKEAARPVLGNDVIPDLAKVENAIKKNDYEGLSQELTAYASLLYRNRR